MTLAYYNDFVSPLASSEQKGPQVLNNPPEAADDSGRSCPIEAPAVQYGGLPFRRVGAPPPLPNDKVTDRVGSQFDYGLINALSHALGFASNASLSMQFHKNALYALLAPGGTKSRRGDACTIQSDISTRLKANAPFLEAANLHSPSAQPLDFPGNRQHLCVVTTFKGAPMPGIENAPQSRLAAQWMGYYANRSAPSLYGQNRGYLNEPSALSVKPYSPVRLHAGENHATEQNGAPDVLEQSCDGAAVMATSNNNSGGAQSKCTAEDSS